MSSSSVSRRRTRALMGALLLSLLALLPLAALAQEEDMGIEPESAEPGEEPTKGLLDVERIELSVFGGTFRGDTYLYLDDKNFNEEFTYDSAANSLLDFSGEPLVGIRSPKKTIENGNSFGGTATFYLSENFGMQFRGALSRADVRITGHTVDDPTTFEWDRSSVDILSGGGLVVYHAGREKKTKVRPFFHLGFGGILTKFDKVDDIGALYFDYGGGVTFGLVGPFRLEVGASWQLFSFNTDEVALNSTVNLGTFGVGLVWRHDVPPEPVEPTSSMEEPALPTAGGGR